MDFYAVMCLIIIIWLVPFSFGAILGRWGFDMFRYIDYLTADEPDPLLFSKNNFGFYAFYYSQLCFKYCKTILKV